MASDEKKNFTEKQLFALFRNVDLIQKKRASNEDYYNQINHVLPSSCRMLPNSNNKINSSIRKYVRMKQSKMSSSNIMQSATNDIILSVDIPPLSPSVIDNHNQPSASTLQLPDVDEAQNSVDEVQLDEKLPDAQRRYRGPLKFTTSFSQSYKDFVDLSDRQKRDKTAPLISMLENFIKVNQFNLSTNQLLSYLLMRENAQEKNLPHYRSGQGIFNETIEQHSSFSTLDAISLMHSLVLSKDQT